MAGDRESMDNGANGMLQRPRKPLNSIILTGVPWRWPRLGWVLLATACSHGQAQGQINAPPVPIAAAAAAESLLVDVRSVDSSIAVNLRYLTSDNFTGAPLPGYEANRAYLRREAAAALGRVQQQLRSEGLGLLVWDGYRPVSGTEGMVAWAERTGNMKLFKQGYIARRSRHNMGVAVDLTLVSLASGKPLEMGTPYDTFSETAHTANATGTAARNRQRLVAAMEAQGFSNYDQEWWHFSIEVPAPQPFNMPVR
jgi:D-alanyl-D-alanine dipeptidase